jgi:RNA polymerase sigma-70 factor (ECF subfamily)
LTDRELLDALRDGSDSAFEKIFRDHYPGLVGFSQSILHDRTAAEEVAQEVMVELWRRRFTIAVQTSLKAYLFRSARNRALNVIRHEKIVTREEENIAAALPAPPAADRPILEGEIEAAIQAAVRTLPPRCREVFELSRFRGLTYAEIANTLDLSIKTVEAQMGKALRLMRIELGPWLERAARQ